MPAIWITPDMLSVVKTSFAALRRIRRRVACSWLEFRTSSTCEMQGCTFIGKVLLAALAVLADVSIGEHLTNASYADDDNQALLQARAKTANGCSNDVDPPLLEIIADFAVASDAGECGAQVFYASPLATDLCDPNPLVVQTGGLSSGATFPVGDTHVTFTATDDSNNTASGTLTVTVEDAEDPGISGLPGSMSVDTDPGLCTATLTYNAPTATDNCPGVAIEKTSGPTSGASVPVGTTGVTFTATDGAGNTATGSFFVTVDDYEHPVISGLPADITVTTDPGLCAAIVTYTAPTATDNCPGVQMHSTGPSSGASFPVGSTYVNFTAFDAVGNIESHIFKVTVDDGLPVSIRVDTDPGLCAAIVTYNAPTAADNCPGEEIVLTSGPSSGASFPVGITDVSFTATDAAGNNAGGSFVVTVHDYEHPVISGLPADITVNTDPGLCAAIVTYTAPTATDNCPGVEMHSTGPSSGASFPVGSTYVSFTAFDAVGNIESHTFKVTVDDVEDPVISGLPVSIRVDTDPGLCAAIVTYNAPTAADNCPGEEIVLTSGPSSGASFPVGITDVSFTATDAAGNTAGGSFVVTVHDYEHPVISGLPADITVTTDPGLCAAIVTYTAPTATDNCPGVEMHSTGPSSGASFPVGSTYVNFTAFDAVGNIESHIFKVTVDDVEDPVISGLPVSIRVDTDPGLCAAIVTYSAPTAADNCPGEEIVLTSGPSSGASFPVGITDVSFTATDAAGNTAGGSFVVTVHDYEHPVISGLPADITVTTDPGLCAAIVTYTAPTATDNCPGVEMHSTGPSSGASFPVGSTYVSFTAFDAVGNIESHIFKVTVDDVEDPVISGLPVSIKVDTDPGLCAAIVTYNAPTAADNCPGEEIVLTSGPSSGASFPVGITDVSFTATDAAGNSDVGSFTVTVSDVEKPVISGLPGNITQPNDPGQCGAVVSYTPTVSDNCENPVLSQDVGVGPGSFPIGSTTETWSATDASGNTDTGTFTVTVSDTENPVISGLPGPMSVDTDPGLCTATLTYNAPTATDNCPGVAIEKTSGPTSGASVPVGTTGVTFTATDGAGNTATGRFFVTVDDYEHPVISGLPADITVNTDPGLCAAIVTYTAPTATDNCPGVQMHSTGPSSGASFPVGSTYVSFTAFDDVGRSTADSFTVTVNDVEDPVISGLPVSITVNTDPGLCSAIVTYAAPTATDNCPAIEKTSGPTSGASVPVGTTDVTFTATDGAGNAASGTFTVQVNDNDPPALEVEDIDIESCSPTAVTFSPTAADNCQGVTAACSPQSGSEFPVGETEVSCTAVDAAGSTTQKSFVVLVECVGQGYPKKSHSNNIRSRRNRRRKKWLQRNRRLKKWLHRNRRLRKWPRYWKYWHH
ncbi:unnamed protein product [Symbiodinium sp. CCMP2592]|nr:unnamed protein product [Symbiodinium sp. CCMP2592]